MRGKVVKFLHKSANGNHRVTNKFKKLWNETPRDERKRELNMENIQNVKTTSVRG